MDSRERADIAPRANEPRRDLFVYNGGFLTNARIRRILDLAGWSIRIGKPGPDDWVGVWGASPTAHRGQAVAGITSARPLYVEDAFLRSLFPGRSGDAPLGLTIDGRAPWFDANRSSDLESLLANHPLDDPALLSAANSAIERISHAHLTKYAAVTTTPRLPDGEFVLIIDQTFDDAAVRLGGGSEHVFRVMLETALRDHPSTPVVIKTHPETALGHRSGYFDMSSRSERIHLITDPVSPQCLFARATEVYTVSSLMGFDAILSGHKPRVFGQPFYAGWGLTHDSLGFTRRNRRLTQTQLFAAAMLIYPVWYDPFRDELCGLARIIDILDAQARAWRQDRHGYVATGISHWKRPHMRRFFGQHGALQFDQTKASGQMRHIVWGSTAADKGAVRVEDGFLRSRGLGARLVPPVSQTLDETGFAHDPNAPSDLEFLISQSPNLPAGEIERAERLISRIVETGLTKYNAGDAQTPVLPEGQKILVVGQVADDASVLLGCTGSAKTDTDVLAAARRAHPEACLVFKPHPDVLAGLRDGQTSSKVADVVLDDCDPHQLLDAVDEVWTLTSLMGFEALLRGVPVTCLGMPFYAGWGLTRDHAPLPRRRHGGITVAGLAHAALIGFPRYLDPVTGMICPAEVAVERLADPSLSAAPKSLRFLSKLQNLTARAGLRR